MSQVKITSEVVRNVNFQVFGTSFNYTLDSSKIKKVKNIPLQAIVPILMRELIDAQYEHSRKDGKKVILFYKQSEHASHLMAFKFAVEADDKLQEMMTKHINLDKQIPQMINYMFDNKDTLNFNV